MQKVNEPRRWTSKSGSGARQRSARSTCLLECNVEWRDEFDVLRALLFIVSKHTQKTKANKGSQPLCRQWSSLLGRLGLVLDLGLGGASKKCCPEVGRVGGEGHIMLSLREFRSGKTEKNGLIASVRGVVSR